MRIRTKLLSVTAVSALTACLVAAVVAATMWHVTRSLERSALYADLMQRVFASNILAESYLSRPTERALSQWNAVRASIENLLQSMNDGSPRERELVSDIKDAQAGVGLLFNDLKNMKLEAASSADSSFAERRDRLTSLLRVRIREKADRAAELLALSQARIKEAQRRAGTIILILLALGMLVVGLANLGVFRGVLGSIDALRASARRVASGDLDEKAAENPDELGDLARDFNVMVRRLRETLADLRDEIREREKAQADLGRSEAQFRMLVETMNEGLALIDGAGRLAYVNDALGRVLREPAEALLGRDAKSVFRLPDVPPGVSPNVGSSVEPDAGPGVPLNVGPGIGTDVGPNVRPDVGPDAGPGVSPNVGPDVGPNVMSGIGPIGGPARTAASAFASRFSQEAELPLPGGETVPTVLSVSPVLGDQGVFGGAIATVTDVSSLKQAERAIRESEQKYRAIFDTSPVGVAHFDRDGTVTACNRRLAEICDVGSEEIVGRNLAALFGEEGTKAVRTALGGDQAAFEGELALSGGCRSTPVQAVLSPTFGLDGSVEGGVAVLEDVAERRRAEEERRRYLARLEQSNRDLQEFAYVASHDLQEPLRKIQAFGDRIQTRQAERLDQTGRDYLERMIAAASRMQALINSLLAFSRVSTRRKPLTPTDLGQTAREVVGDLEARLADTGGRVEIGPLPIIHADPDQMRQLFQNLIGNGLKFHKPDQPPLVSVRSEPDSRPGWLRLVVEDNGVGFERQHAERIFMPFQRLHGRGTFEGSGIGLAICRRIAERHGGTIEADSEPGQGSRFIVTLPEKPQGDALP